MTKRTQARVLSIGTAQPPYVYTQDEVFAMTGYRRQIIQRVFDNASITKRHLALEPDHKVSSDANWFSNHYAKWAVRLSVQAARRALERAKLKVSDIDYLVATSCTGYLCPGLSHYIAAELGLHSTARLSNLVGMGCSAAIPALERATEFTERRQESTALVVSTEICSATYWIDDNDLETAVGNAIFGDGAAAAIVSTNSTRDLALGPRPVLQSFATAANRELIDYMGYENVDGRLRLMLSRDVPEAVLPLIGSLLKDLLKENHLSMGDIANWIIHPGGRKILEGVEKEWNLAGRLSESWSVLDQCGNMSSATILFVLERVLQTAKAHEQGVMVGVGPGLAVEGALLRWD